MVADNPQTAPSADTTPKPRRSRTKGIVAIAIGAVLLLGGGTTFAYWSTSQSLSTGTINTGDLNLTASGAAWTLTAANGAVTNGVNPSTVKLVPGDVLTLTEQLAVTLVGDTIKADLTLVRGSGVDPALATAVTLKNGATTLTPTSGTTYRLTTSATLTATVTVTFASTTANRTLVNTAIAPTDLTFTLTQMPS
jgi:alternate signal-mediated exported protein